MSAWVNIVDDVAQEDPESSNVQDSKREVETRPVKLDETKNQKDELSRPCKYPLRSRTRSGRTL